MCICEVSGGSKHQREVAYSVVQHCVNALMPNVENLDVCIKIADIKKHWGSDLYAYCEETDQHSYLIHIERTLDPGMFVRYLCHEMVHVMQYTQGTLQELHGSPVPGTVIWMGQELAEHDYRYIDLPWEAQAFEMQESLAEKFFVDLGATKTELLNFKQVHALME